MSLKRKFGGGVLVVLGLMLSPLTWWNDAFVNFPLALAFAWLIASFSPAVWREVVFQVALVIGYWLTNVLGLVLMHKGARQFKKAVNQPEARRELVKDLWIAVGYTALICGQYDRA